MGILITIGSLSVYAESNIKMSLSADENIKPGKTFNVILNISDSGNLGAVHASFIYDSTKLKLKSCVIEGKTSEEYLKYNDAEGEINLIYMIKNRPSKEAIIKFRFEPYKSEETTYKFSSGFFEAVNFKQEKSVCTSVPNLTISVSQSGSAITQKSSNNPESQNKTPQSQNDPENNSKNKKQTSIGSSSSKNTSNTNKNDEYSEKEKNLTKEQNSNDTVIHEFDVTSHESKTDSSVILTLIGFVIIVIISVIVTKVTVNKLRKKYME